MLAEADVSTKVRSYYQTQAEGLGATVNRKVVVAVLNSPIPLTRRELSIKTGHTVQSMCRAVYELREMGFIEIVGEKYDEQTDREVETVHYPKTIKSIKQLNRAKKADRLEAIEERSKALKSKGAMIYWEGKLYPIETAFKGLL